ncbi:MAG: hypothetical protein JNM58_11255 [Xanthomonadaceae bacterium]|nr:hypothetical protein [Xanthomonadaceae bacterium]
MEPRPFRAPAIRTALLALLFALFGIADACAYTVTIGTGTKAAYLRIGDGTMTGGNYNAGGTPADNTTVNLVSVTVPAASVGNATAQAMTGTGRVTSDWDGFAFCNAGQTYIAAFFRLPTNPNQSATLRVNTPVNLTSAGGDTIPISQISWTSSGNGDTGAQPFPAGTFTGGTQTLATLLRNTWAESCHSFSYANAAIRAAGTYDARATYTLATP